MHLNLCRTARQLTWVGVYTCLWLCASLRVVSHKHYHISLSWPNTLTQVSQEDDREGGLMHAPAAAIFSSLVEHPSKLPFYFKAQSP